MQVQRSQRFSSSSVGGGGGMRSMASGGSLRRSGAQSCFSSMGGGMGYGMGGGGMGGGGGGMSFGMGGGSGGGGFGFANGAGAFGAGGGEGGSFIMGNEKQHMHELNDRLATYLEKVRTLEATNKDLEEKLRNFTTSKVESHDYSAYEAQLKPIRDQIINIILENARLALEMDNAKLAADDFRMKFEAEYAIRQSVEADINGLGGLKKEYEFNHKTLLQDIEGLKDELDFLKKNHEEELASLRSEMSGTVSVDLQAAPAVDLQRVLDDIRAEYEGVARRSQEEAERWFVKQAETKQAEVAQSTEALQSTKTEFTDLRRQYQNLQAELDALNASKSSLEQELMNVRDSMTAQSQEYQNLLNIKMKLEMEIATYKKLLEGAEPGVVMLGGGGAGVNTSQTVVITKETKTVTT
ncbi:keratin, type I cytoskeletal 50 kDa-like [Acipenser oxyrinchus oxyrinchus]|uniref:Keratin, type I cytoskeletal 50 kDa-like n=1 Tax=Acipenser oxyrinchus oxyrinchus TaxID=40147 RepID=A0AAD8CPI6_ACIOX|nr:keratin, type I cytoskeletal 50 kDa-like [Acipenser oxyrinchus oxyrinchus]